jgi:beta-glucanase (GH16 family)
MRRPARTLFFVLASGAVAACASNGSGTSSTGGSGAGGQSTGGSVGSGGGVLPTGGVTASGGSSASTGAGGRVGTGGSPGAGGTMTDSGVGGTASVGGSSASGGRQGSGGDRGTGGVQGSGGASAGAPGTGGAATPSAKCPDTTWKLAWSDEFEGSAGAAADASKWTYDTGPNWYNGELQDYTSGTTNASLDGNGNLVIEAREEAREGKQYTSARLKTEGKKTFTYGRFEGRMKLPYGQGMWPAFWMLGGNSWPNTGEIDIMENLGREPSIVHGTFHGPGYSGAAGPTASYTLPGGAKLSDDFHVFAIEWETNVVRWYVDGILYSTKTPSDIKGNTWVFDHGFFFILNLAVGGEWPGNPDSTSVFPQKMVIDYVRVCQK